MKTLIAVIVIGIIFYALYEFLGVYQVFSKATYKANLSTIGSLITDPGEKFKIVLVNHVNKKMSIENMSVELIKNDRVMGGFEPVNVSLVKGENTLELKFLNNTKFVQIGVDYAVNQLSDYKIRFSGTYLKLIPFKISIKASKIIG